MAAVFKKWRVITVLGTMILVTGFLMSGCSKSSKESERETKTKKETEEVSDVSGEDTSEDTVVTKTETSKETTTEPSETTIPLDPERVRVAGTYEGYAIKTKASAYPENGSVNDFAIIQKGRSFRLILNEDGTAKWEDSKEGDREINDWSASDNKVTINFASGTLNAVLKDGIILVEETDKYWYFVSTGVSVNADWAITEDEAKVERGDDYLFARKNTEYNPSEAVKLYTAAGEAGVGKGWQRLGYYYQHKTLAEGHYDKAISYYDKAIELGCPLGYYSKGNMYLDGAGVDKNPDTALSYFKQAVDGGCLMGYNGMGEMCYNGTAHGISGPDGNKAIEYFNKALASNDWLEKAFATNHIGIVYHEGTGSLTPDPAKAEEWYKKAMDLGYPVAYYNYGHLFYKGAFGTQDYVKARSYYNEAAARGSGSAYYDLGRIFENGNGVNKSLETAFQCYMKAYEYGNAKSAYKIGRCYDGAYGVDQNYTKAMDFYLVGAREKVPEVFGWIGCMFSDGKGGTQDDAKAIEWWTKGYALKNSHSATNLGWTYQYGKSVPIDYDKALFYYAEAIVFARTDDTNQHRNYAEDHIQKLLNEGHITQEQADAAMEGRKI